MILKQALNKIRDLHSAELTGMEFGDDGTATSESQTDLISPVASSEVSVSITTSDKSIAITGRLTSTDAVDEDLREVIVKNITGDLAHTRNVIPTITHTANDEVVVIKTLFYRQA